jgi:xanthine/CO dehydrogenase XdhC/CoxF family maturation factor
VRDVLETIQTWQAQGKEVALATVIMTGGSTPRRAGARLAVSSAGEMSGSVSGGCVENDVFYHAQEVLKAGQPRLVRYAISDDMVWDVGLACGGTIEVWIERLEPTEPDTHQADQAQVQVALVRALEKERMVALAVLLEGAGNPGAKLLVWPSGETTGTLNPRPASMSRSSLLRPTWSSLAAYTSPFR